MIDLCGHGASSELKDRLVAAASRYLEDPNDSAFLRSCGKQCAVRVQCKKADARFMSLNCVYCLPTLSVVDSHIPNVLRCSVMPFLAPRWYM